MAYRVPRYHYHGEERPGSHTNTHTGHTEIDRQRQRVATALTCDIVGKKPQPCLHRSRSFTSLEKSTPMMQRGSRRPIDFLRFRASVYSPSPLRKRSLFHGFSPVGKPHVVCSEVDGVVCHFSSVVRRLLSRRPSVSSSLPCTASLSAPLAPQSSTKHVYI